MSRIGYEGAAVVVTGAGRGMGRTHALELARRGASVVVNDLRGSVDYGEESSHSAADDVVAEIEAAGGAAVASYESVASAEGGRAIVELALAAFGRLDAIVHNAGIRRHMFFEEMSDDDIRTVVDTHLGGGLWLTRAAWPRLQASGSGRIVLISSGAGAFGMEGVAQYAAAKAGLIGLARALACEGAKYGIRTNSVLPAARTVDPDGPRVIGRTTVAVERERTRRSMTDRHQPELVTALVVYLASGACSVNGECYSSVRGRYARAFTGLTEGWHSPAGRDVAAEDIEEHLDEIRDEAGYWVPPSVIDELERVAEAARVRS